MTSHSVHRSVASPRRLWGTGARVPSTSNSRDHALQIRIDSYSNSTRTVDIVQCGARSGASGWYWQDCAQIFSARRQFIHSFY